jgi:hypothetical protein
MLDNRLELGAGFGALMRAQIGLAAHIRRIECSEESSKSVSFGYGSQWQARFPKRKTQNLLNVLKIRPSCLILILKAASGNQLAGFGVSAIQYQP